MELANAPIDSGLPLLGCALPLLKKPTAFLAKKYRDYGPVFRIRVPGETLVVFAGIEANQLLSQAESDLLTTKYFWNDYEQALGLGRIINSLDGQEHAEVRKLLAPGFSRSVFESKFDTIADLLHTQMQTWKPGNSLNIFKTFQQVLFEQLGQLLLSSSIATYTEDLRIFSTTLLTTTIAKSWPRFMLRTSRYKRARNRSLEFGAELIRRHQENQTSATRTSDLVDTILEAKTVMPNTISNEAINFWVLAPLIAGLEVTPNICSFMLYHLLSSPDLLKRAVDEIDGLFIHGKLSLAGFDRAPILFGTMMEALRFYPIASMTIRNACKIFDFQGYTVQAGQRILFATSVVNLLENFYPNPEKFDIYRYSDPRNEHQTPGVFTAFGFGPHSCMGMAIAKLQIMLNVATVLHFFQMTLDPPTYRLKLNYLPTPRPNRKFRLRILNQRFSL